MVPKLYVLSSTVAHGLGMRSLPVTPLAAARAAVAERDRELERLAGVEDAVGIAVASAPDVVVVDGQAVHCDVGPRRRVAR